MNTSSMTPSPLTVTLFALMTALPLGCDPVEGDDHDALADSVAALERSPSQDLVEVEESESIAFDAIDALTDASEYQTEGAGCTLLRPAAWSGPGVTCVEYYKAPGAPADLEPMVDGESFIAHARLSGAGLGRGRARISCNDGTISIQALSCAPGGILE